MTCAFLPLVALLATASRATPVPPDTPPPVSPADRWQDALDAAVARWDSLGISDYNYRYRRSCFCLPPYTQWMSLEVRDAAFSAGYYLNGTAIPADVEGSVPTVGDMFAIIQDAINGQSWTDEPVATMEVAYHPHYGYPRDVHIDYTEMVADEEVTWKAKELEVVCEDHADCHGAWKCSRKPHRCRCRGGKCRKKKKDCATSGSEMERWGCRNGKECVAGAMNDNGETWKWGECKVVE